MRDFLAGLLVLGGLGAAGYALWVTVQQNRGAQLRERTPRAGTLAVAALIALLLGGAVASAKDNGDSRAKDETTTVEDVAETSTTATAETSGESVSDDVVADAEQAVDDDHYTEAIALAARLGDRDQSRITRRISRRLAIRALRALKNGNRQTAARLLAEAQNYPSTPQARGARASLRTAQARAAAVRAAKRRAARVRAERRRVARAAKAEREREARQAREAAQAAEEAAAAEDTAPEGDDPSQYAGMTCTEIGHSFTVTPGSDPDHDANNDGVACESQ